MNRWPGRWGTEWGAARGKPGAPSGKAHPARSRKAKGRGITTDDYDHQRVIHELQAVIDDTQRTLSRFEATGMDEQMPDDYQMLLAILDDAVTRQREHTQAMLGQV